MGLLGSNYYVQDLLDNNFGFFFLSNSFSLNSFTYLHGPYSLPLSHLIDVLSAEFERIWVMLNFDMIGSPNPIRGIYDGDSAEPEINVMSAAVQRMFGTKQFSQSHPF